MSPDDAVDDLHAQLLAAADRLENRPRRERDRGRLPRLLAAAAVVVLVLVGAFVVVAPRQASADIEVIRQGDELVVRLTDIESRPDEIEAAAKEAGLDVTVEEVPVGPSNVGRFAGLTSSAFVEGLEPLGGDATTGFNGFRVPVDFPGQVRVQLGREAGPGETWAISSSSTAEGEPLACDEVFGRPLSEVLQLIEDRGIDDVRVFVVEAGELTGLATALHSSATVLSVTNPDPGSVFVDAVDSLSSVPPQTALPSYGCG